jgi:hypothetical protein
MNSAKCGRRFARKGPSEMLARLGAESDATRIADPAVAAAYSWPADIVGEDALARLLALNLGRAAADR